MPSNTDIAWLAGILDGEGCIAFARRTDYNKHRLEVRYDVKLAMACRKTVETAYEIIAELVGDDCVNEPYEERRKVAVVAHFGGARFRPRKACSAC